MYFSKFSALHTHGTLAEKIPQSFPLWCCVVLWRRNTVICNTKSDAVHYIEIRRRAKAYIQPASQTFNHHRSTGNSSIAKNEDVVVVGVEDTELEKNIYFFLYTHIHLSKCAKEVLFTYVLFYYYTQNNHSLVDFLFAIDEEVRKCYAVFGMCWGSVYNIAERPPSSSSVKLCRSFNSTYNCTGSWRLVGTATSQDHNMYLNDG